MRKVLTVIVSCTAAVFTALGADFDWQAQLSPGQSIDIRGVHGSIVATGRPGNTATVRATISGSNDPSSVKVVAVPFTGGVVICAIYPDSPDAEHPNQCNPPDIYVGAYNNDARVDFTVTVPSGVLFSALTIDGDIQATGLSAHVGANALNGNVVMSTSGDGEASVLHGSINAVLGSTKWRGAEMFRCGDGNLDLQLPSDANTTVQAMAFFGAIISEFPAITSTSSRDGRSSMAQGTLGSGGRSLTLSVFHGNITIHQGPASAQ